MSQSTIAYFGYGSLVNTHSLRTPYISCHRVTLRGWARIWLSRPGVKGSFANDDGLAFLSVTPSAQSEIDGLLIVDHATSLPALDEREALYSRVVIDEDALTFHDDKPDTQDCFLYVADEVAASAEASILRSYLDVVMQGYLHQYDEAGVERFLQTTQNFEIPVFEDRHEPKYPRATQLTSDEQTLFDKLR